MSGELASPALATPPPAGLEQARWLAGVVDRRIGCSARVAAALLLRQELEQLLHSFFQQRAPGLEGCPMRAQLVALPYYLPEPALGRRAAQAWAELSAACHHDAYELALLPEELRRLATIVEELAHAVESPADGDAPPAPQSSTS